MDINARKVAHELRDLCVKARKPVPLRTIQHRLKLLRQRIEVAGEI